MNNEWCNQMSWEKNLQTNLLYRSSILYVPSRIILLDFIRNWVAGKSPQMMVTSKALLVSSAPSSMNYSYEEWLDFNQFRIITLMTGKIIPGVIVWWTPSYSPAISTDIISISRFCIWWCNKSGRSNHMIVETVYPDMAVSLPLAETFLLNFQPVWFIAGPLLPPSITSRVLVPAVV